MLPGLKALSSKVNRIIRPNDTESVRYDKYDAKSEEYLDEEELRELFNKATSRKRSPEGNVKIKDQ